MSADVHRELDLPTCRSRRVFPGCVVVGSGFGGMAAQLIMRCCKYCMGFNCGYAMARSMYGSLGSTMFNSAGPGVE